MDAYDGDVPVSLSHLFLFNYFGYFFVNYSSFFILFSVMFFFFFLFVIRRVGS